MNSCLTVPGLPSGSEDRDVCFPEDLLRGRLRMFLRALAHSSNSPDRRCERRYPYPRLIRIFPVDGYGGESAGQRLVVVGKHISESGIGFFHSAPLPHRRVIIELGPGGAAPLAVLTDLTWCRFSGDGWYENGGRFLQLVGRGENPQNLVPDENVT